jgi:hypothetical protein
LANGFSTFKQNHGIVTGAIFTTVGLVGVVGSITGELANMIAALFVPDILFTVGGTQADKPASSVGSVTSISTSNPLVVNPIIGPILSWGAKTLGL